MLPLSTRFHFRDTLFIANSSENVDFIEEGASPRFGLDIFYLEGRELIFFVFNFVDFAKAALTNLAEDLIFGVKGIVI